MKKQIWLMVLLFITSISLAQAGLYAPTVGTAGSTAIYKDDASFLAWATGCTIARGPMTIADPSKGVASYGTDAVATGKADNSVVSLGDGGSAVLTFSSAICDGVGYDFAVFENGFNDTFLELGFVEVSSDGVNYFRFNSVSLTPTTTQVGGFGAVDCTNVHNLAGKYRANYGTPFDLSELAGVSPLLNINRVTHVRIVDVVGCIQNEYCSYDSQGHKVNDPWSTPFSSSGFDLDAVGVIHQIPEPATLLFLASGLMMLRRKIRH